MAKSIKLKNNNYIDSTDIVHNRELLSSILNKITYSEGSWTPTMANANVTYTMQQGYYLKIGNLVFVTWYLRGTINSVSNPYYAFINGLPFNSLIDQAGSLFQYAYCFNNDTTPRLVRINGNRIGIQSGAAGGTGISSWEAGHGTFYLSGSATYLTND